MRRVREAIGILVLADEPWFSPRDGALLAEQGACDIINIKLIKTGGLNRARNVGTVVSVQPPALPMACWKSASVPLPTFGPPPLHPRLIIYRRAQRSCCLHARRGNQVLVTKGYRFTVSNNSGLGVTLDMDIIEWYQVD